MLSPKISTEWDLKTLTRIKEGIFSSHVISELRSLTHSPDIVTTNCSSGTNSIWYILFLSPILMMSAKKNKPPKLKTNTNNNCRLPEKT